MRLMLSRWMVALVSRLLGVLIPRRTPEGSALPDVQDLAILVIKPASIGDVLMATPVLGCIRRLYPGSQITFMVGHWSRVAVVNNPDIDDVIDCGHVGTPGLYSIKEYLSLVWSLRKRHFDVAVVLDRSPLMALFPYLAGIKYRLGINSKGRGIGLTTATSPVSGENEVELYLRVLRAAGLKTEDARSRFRPSAQDVQYAHRLMEEWNVAEERMVVIAPGGGWNPGSVNLAKRWCPQGFATVADYLQTRTAYRVVMVGQESDEEALRGVARFMATDTVNLLGQTSFGQLGAVLQLAAAFLGNDSAPGHLSAAVGTRTVTVFTNSDSRQFLPFAPGAAGVVAGDLKSTCDAVVTALNVESMQFGL